MIQHDGETCSTAIRERTLDKAQALDRFLASVERKAFRIAEIAVGNHEEALDIVQDAMLRLVQKYADKPEAEWKPLFYRILQSRIRDWYRRNKVRNKWMSWLGFKKDEDSTEQENPIETLADPAGRDPSQQLANSDSMQQLENSMQALPPRQQQAFLLRTIEGLSVAETATAMGCSEGSVKTHYSRAVHSLRVELEEHWHE